MASQTDLNPLTGFITSISKKTSHTSFLCACELDNDGSIASGNPFPLANKKELQVWENRDISMEGLHVRDVIKYCFRRDKFVFIAKTGGKMVSVNFCLKLATKLFYLK